MPRTTASKTASKRAGATAQKSDETMLRELFLEELKDIYKATHAHRYHNKKTNDQL